MNVFALRCWLRGQHAPGPRLPIGGWRCTYCGTPLADLDEAGMDSGYVPTSRREFDRAAYARGERG